MGQLGAAADSDGGGQGRSAAVAGAASMGRAGSFSGGDSTRFFHSGGRRAGFQNFRLVVLPGCGAWLGI